MEPIVIRRLLLDGVCVLRFVQAQGYDFELYYITLNLELPGKSVPEPVQWQYMLYTNAHR